MKTKPKRNDRSQAPLQGQAKGEIAGPMGIEPPKKPARAKKK